MSDRDEDSLTGRTYAEAVRGFLAQDGERSNAFLRQQWLISTTAMLRQLRRDAGLTQNELAARLGTTQSAIARLERDTAGRFSLHRLIDYMVACGVQPFEIDSVPSEEMAAYFRHSPEGDRTFRGFLRWAESRSVIDWPVCGHGAERAIGEYRGHRPSGRDLREERLAEDDLAEVAIWRRRPGTGLSGRSGWDEDQALDDDAPLHRWSPTGGTPYRLRSSAGSKFVRRSHEGEDRVA